MYDNAYITRYIRSAWWVTQSTNTQSEFVKHLHCLSCVSLFSFVWCNSVRNFAVVLIVTFIFGLRFIVIIY
jgi:hypothetical protein